MPQTKELKNLIDKKNHLKKLCEDEDYRNKEHSPILYFEPDDWNKPKIEFTAEEIERLTQNGILSKDKKFLESDEAVLKSEIEKLKNQFYHFNIPDDYIQRREFIDDVFRDLLKIK